MKRPLYYLLCAIACTSMVSATMPMAAIAEAIQPQSTAAQQTQTDTATSDTDKAEGTTSSNATGSSDPTSDTEDNSGAPAGATSATDTATPAAPTPQPSLQARTTPTPEAISTTSQTGYAHSATATQNGVTFTVSWNDAPAGAATTFHVTQTNGSSQAKARMDVPTYWDGGSQESVCDPSRPAWASYYWRYEKEGPNAMVLTSNIAPSGWDEFFTGDDTLLCALDRLFDKASVFVMRGPSYRGRGLDTYSVEAVPQAVKVRGIQTEGM